MEGECKIFFVFDNDDNTESLWADKIGDYYELKNVPFFSRGISLGDIVEAKLLNGNLMYNKTISSSGHSTYRIYSFDNDKLDFFWKILSQLGCTYERATENLYAIDVPSESDVYKVYEVLELGEKRGAWEFEEGHCGHPLSESTT